MEYNLDSLIKTFEKHAIKFEKDQDEWMEKYPDIDRVQVYDGDFSISRALFEMCKEIKKLNRT